MEEAADEDAVLIIDAGRRVASGTPLDLKNAYTGDFITLYGVSEAQVRLLGTPYTALRGAYRIEVPDTAAATSLILGASRDFHRLRNHQGADGRRVSGRDREKSRGGCAVKTLYYVTARNMKLFFKDKGMFFTSLITPLILLVLFSPSSATFTAIPFCPSSPTAYRCPPRWPTASWAAGCCPRCWRSAA